MLKHFLTAAVLGLFLSLGAMSRADAAPVSPGAGVDQTRGAVDSTFTPVRGGWWVVPAIVGGVILYHELHRHHHHCYRRCWWHHGRRYCRRYC